MRKLYLFAAMAAMLAACSSDDLTKESAVAQQNAEEGAVVFDAYQSRGTTRAGITGTMTLDLLKDLDAGFGVFGYYTNNEGYSELAKPDFMYNQDVKYTTGWTYSPIKYWPNEFGTEASSERVDYLTFFAYAPYVPTDPKTGKVEKDGIKSTETGIIALTRNTAIGDPLVKYVVDFNPTNCVDLCWGVVADDFKESVTTTAPKNNLEKGKPFIDVIKPQVDSKIKFDFKHALTQLNVQIDADIDDDSHSHVLDVNGNTRIYVRSVTFEGFTDRGTLNLNSDANATTKPIWYDIAGSGNLSTNPVTVYDGRYDGREGVDHVAAPAEMPLGLNEDIIQSTAYTDPFGSVTADPGVTKDAVNLFKPVGSTPLEKKECPILVIPNGQPLTVKVVYDVETYDPSLATFLSDGKTHGSTIENAIKQEIKLTSSGQMILESGKKYTVRLHLGLTSVKFDAMVSDWVKIPAIEGDADLPINNGGSVSSTDTDPLTTTMPAVGGTYTFIFADAEGAITEHNTPADESAVTATYNDKVVTLTVIPNNTLKEIKHEVTLTDTESKSVKVEITQAPAALGLVAPTGVVSGDETFTLTSAKATDWSAANVTITRKRGTKTETITPGDIAGSSTTGTVTLDAADVVKAGDVFTVKVQAEEAEEETVSFTVGKAPGTISFSATDVNYNITGPSFTKPTFSNTKTGESSVPADGNVTFSIAKLSGSGNTKAEILDPSSDDVTITGAEVGDKFTVTATVVDGKEYAYDAKTASYTITIINE